MLRNYLLTALRNIARHKLYSFINIAGLGVGLACLILIMLYVRDQLLWDRWLPDNAGLYRVSHTMTPPGGASLRIARTPYLLPALMKDNLPEVTAATRLVPQSLTVTAGDRQFVQAVQEADANLFQVIRLPFIAGDPATALTAPESIVLSQATARKFFGAANPMGRNVSITRADSGAPVTLRVTGIFRDLPHESQIRAEAIVPITSQVDRVGDTDKARWVFPCCYSYVRLAPGTDPAALLTKLNAVIDRQVDLPARLNTTMPASRIMQVHLTPYAGVHIQAAGEAANMVPGTSRTEVVGLALIGIIILTAACCNFTNLATAGAMLRAREIGLRKCVGARRTQVIVQFLGEAVVIALLALIFALALVEIILPAYGNFLGYPIGFSYRDDWRLVLTIVTIAVMAGLASGFYPALVLSGFRPAIVMRGGNDGLAGSGWLRLGLVVMQFAVSIALAIAAIVMFVQIDFVHGQELGFRRDNLVVINTAGRLSAGARDAFAGFLRQQPGIAGAALSNKVPFSATRALVAVKTPGRPSAAWIEAFWMTPEFPGLYGMKLAAGRMLSESRGEDEAHQLGPEDKDHNFMINQAAARSFGFTPDQAVGKVIQVSGVEMRIAGVLRDAHFDAALEPARPLMFFYGRSQVPMLTVRLTGKDVAQTLAFIDASWHRYSPSTAITRFFLDDNFQALYRADEKQDQLLAAFVGIAVFIACLGLFGLAGFAAARRTREIGIRKAFGARNRDVLILLLWQFSVPVLIANAVAWPLAWYYLHGWLQSFAYRIDLNPLYFVTTGFAALLIAWATIFAHAWRVARANPIHALRTE